MREKPADIPMADPLAYFLTWTTYGTWLPGDKRGWVDRPGQFRPANPGFQAAARSLLTEDPCELDTEQRRLVEDTIAKHCKVRGWHLHVVNCRTRHVHVVVTAPIHPKTVRDQFKAWCTRHLKELQRAHQADHSQPVRVKWWTEGGSRRWLNDPESLENAITYAQIVSEGRPIVVGHPRWRTGACMGGTPRWRLGLVWAAPRAGAWGLYGRHPALCAWGLYGRHPALALGLVWAAPRAGAGACMGGTPRLALGACMGGTPRCALGLVAPRACAWGLWHPASHWGLCNTPRMALGACMGGTPRCAWGLYGRHPASRLGLVRLTNMNLALLQLGGCRAVTPAVRSRSGSSSTV